MLHVILKRIFIIYLAINLSNLYGQTPINDDCNKAINIVVNSTQFCSSVVNGTTTGSTASTTVGQSSCSPSSIDDDVWYKFTATDVKHVIELSGSSPLFFPSFEAYSGSCGNLTSLGICASGSTGGVIELATGLTIGETYLIRVYSNTSNPGYRGPFTLCVSSIPNDDCVGAENLSIGALCTATFGNTKLATQSSISGQALCSSHNGWNDDDLWFKFTTPATPSSSYNISVDGGSFGAGIGLVSPNFSVYSGVCGALNLLSSACTTPTSGACVYTQNSNITNLSANTTYYVRVYSWVNASSYRGKFNICVTNGTGVPVLTSSQTALNFGSLCLGDSLVKSFVLNGANLNGGNISINALQGFSYSTDNVNFSPILDITSCGGSLTQTIYVKFLPSNTQSYNGNISIIGGGGNSNISVIASASSGLSAEKPVIIVSANPVCIGNNVTLSIQSGSLNNSSYWQWYIDGCGNTPIDTGSIITVSPIGSNIKYYVRGEGGCTLPGVCDTIEIQISGNTNPSISINTNSTFPVCEGSNVTFNSNISNGGTTPTYQWKINNIDQNVNSAIFSSSIINDGDIISCTLISNEACAVPNSVNSNTITASTLTPVTPAILLQKNPTFVVCDGEIITFNATINNEGTSPVLQWQVNGINAGNGQSSFNTSSLNNGDVITCTLLSDATCASPNTVVSSDFVFSEIETVFEQINITLCNNEELNVNGTIINSPGIFNDTLTSSLGCDSIIEITVTATTIDTSLDITNGTTLVSAQNNASYLWLDCSTLDIIPNQTAQSYSPLIPGSFASIIEYNGCTDTTTCVSVVITNIEELAIDNISIFPNPFNSVINLLFGNDTKGVVEISLYSITGKKLLFKQAEVVDNKVKLDIDQFHEIPNGIYFLVINSNANKMNYKVYKN
jgi:hypothetical protein